MESWLGLGLCLFLEYLLYWTMELNSLLALFQFAVFPKWEGFAFHVDFQKKGGGWIAV